MKKYLIFLLLVITLFTTSCKKQEKTFIESSKVSCYEDLNTSSKTLYLNIYTSTNFVDLKLKDHHNILDSDIVFKTITKYIYNDEEVDAIFYQFKIIFAANQFSITHLTFTCKDKEFEVNIGRYQLVKIPSNDTLITGVIDINENKVIMYIHNGIDRTIYLSKISTYLVNHNLFKINKHQLIDAYIYEGTTRLFTNVSFNIPPDLLCVSGILKLEFTTNIKEYVIYVNYSFNKSKEVIKIQEA